MKQNNYSQGHRGRIKQKFMLCGTNFLDYELLELLLTYSIPRKDVKVLAKTLIQDFGSLGKVLSAEIEDLLNAKGVGDNTAVLIKLCYRICNEILKKEVENKPVISNWDQLINYFFAKLAFHKKEQVYVVYLNTKNTIIKDEMISQGNINHAIFDPKSIIEKSINLGASSIIIAHNHPSGDYSPSKEDIEVTNKINSMLKVLNIFLFDHLIVSQKGVFSFRDSELLT